MSDHLIIIMLLWLTAGEIFSRLNRHLLDAGLTRRKASLGAFLFLPLPFAFSAAITMLGAYFRWWGP
jgi:hypothetical protein